MKSFSEFALSDRQGTRGVEVRWHPRCQKRDLGHPAAHHDALQDDIRGGRSVEHLSPGRYTKGLKIRFESRRNRIPGLKSEAWGTRLMQQIAEIVKRSEWTQAEAASRCGVTQPRINDLLRGRIARFTLDALVNIAATLGRKVTVTLDDAA